MNAKLSLFPTDPLVKLRDVEQLLAEHFYRASRPSRATIICWIEDGTLRGKQIGPGRNYYVYKSSLDRLITELSDEAVSQAA